MKPGTIQLEQNFYTRFSRMWMFLPAGMKGFFILGQVLFEELLIWFCTPVEILCRRRFGTRALSLFVVLQLTTVSIFILSGPGLHYPLLAIFAVAAALAGIYRFHEARVWEKSGNPYRHSYAPGESLPFWKPVKRLIARRGLDPEQWLSEWMIARFGEPILCLILGLALVYIDPFLGSYLLVAAIMLGFKGHISFQRYVNLQRDRKDAQVVSQWMSRESTVSNQPAEKFFVARVVPARSSGERPDSGISEIPNTNGILEPPRKIVRSCPNCASRIKVKEKHLGKQFPCPGCNQPFVVPA
jgi:hypothetical protein